MAVRPAVANAVALLTVWVAMAPVAGNLCFAQQGGKGIDRAKAIVVVPFESSPIEGSSGLPAAIHDAVRARLREAALFSAVLTPLEANDKDKSKLVEISGRLVDFAPGNMAKRLLAFDMGAGRPHAECQFTIKDSATGEIVWQGNIKQTSSINNPGTSSTLRSTLPDRLAEQLVKELKIAK